MPRRWAPLLVGMKAHGPAVRDQAMEDSSPKKMGVADAQASTETINDARLAVRLVSNDGDVLWSTTQESKGAKYKGAGADAADKVVKQLLWDLEKLDKEAPSASAKN